MKTRSIRSGLLHNIRRIPNRADRIEAWRLFKTLPPEHFVQPGSQAVERERREANR